MPACHVDFGGYPHCQCNNLRVRFNGTSLKATQSYAHSYFKHIHLYTKLKGLVLWYLEDNMVHEDEGG